MKPTYFQAQIERLARNQNDCGTYRPLTRIATLDDCKPEAQRLRILEATAQAIINRINFPKNLAGKASQPRKAGKVRTVLLSPETPFSPEVTTRASLHRKPRAVDKVRPLLSEEEEKDARQAVALALIRSGAFERQKMTFGDWKCAFAAARGRECLRIDRDGRGIGAQAIALDSLSEAETRHLAAKEEIPSLPDERRAIIARKIRYARATAFAAFRADTKRTRKANLRNTLAFLRFAASQYLEGKAAGISEVVASESPEADAMLCALRVKKMRIMEYLAKGEAQLDAECEAETRAPITLASGSFNSFASLEAIAD